MRTPALPPPPPTSLCQNTSPIDYAFIRKIESVGRVLSLGSRRDYEMQLCDWLDRKDRHLQPRDMNSLNRFADPVYCVMRLVVGLTYACHGSQKLLAIPGGGHGAAGIALVAGFVELFAGLGIAFGFLTRIAAFFASGEMAVAYFMFYVGAVDILAAKFFPIMNGGELALVLCWVFFFIIFYGPGRWSIDALLTTGRTSAP